MLADGWGELQRVRRRPRANCLLVVVRELQKGRSRGIR
jgi:hypothetical protein